MMHTSSSQPHADNTTQVDKKVEQDIKSIMQTLRQLNNEGIYSDQAHIKSAINSCVTLEDILSNTINAEDAMQATQLIKKIIDNFKSASTHEVCPSNRQTVKNNIDYCHEIAAQLPTLH